MRHLRATPGRRRRFVRAFAHARRSDVRHLRSRRSQTVCRVHQGRRLRRPDHHVLRPVLGRSECLRRRQRSAGVPEQHQRDEGLRRGLRRVHGRRGSPASRSELAPREVQFDARSVRAAARSALTWGGLTSPVAEGEPRRGSGPGRAGAVRTGLKRGGMWLRSRRSSTDGALVPAGASPKKANVPADFGARAAFGGWC